MVDNNDSDAALILRVSQQLHSTVSGVRSVVGARVGSDVWKSSVLHLGLNNVRLHWNLVWNGHGVSAVADDGAVVTRSTEQPSVLFHFNKIPLDSSNKSILSCRHVNKYSILYRSLINLNCWNLLFVLKFLRNSHLIILHYGLIWAANKLKRTNWNFQNQQAICCFKLFFSY